jgi:hypothetical protein
MILAVTRTYLSWQSNPPYGFALPLANGFTLSQMKIDVKYTWQDRRHLPFSGRTSNI